MRKFLFLARPRLPDVLGTKAPNMTSIGSSAPSLLRSSPSKCVVWCHMTICPFVMLACTVLLAKPLAAESVPFDICAESTTWTRPTPEVQAKIWNDNRYKDFARTAYEWTHNFIAIEPDSASRHYHFMNLSGIWTAMPGSYKNCYPDEKTSRHEYEWIEVWVLLHRVTQITRDANTYTVTVEPTGVGFQSVFIRRLNPVVVLRFVTRDGRELEKWDESAPPDRIQQTVPAGAVIRAPNGLRYSEIRTDAMLNKSI